MGATAMTAASQPRNLQSPRRGQSHHQALATRWPPVFEGRSSPPPTLAREEMEMKDNKDIKDDAATGMRDAQPVRCSFMCVVCGQQCISDNA